MKRQKSNQREVKKLIRTPNTRIGTAQKSHIWFFHTYLSDHVEYPIADFHREMFAITQDDKIKFAVICSFRGSGKSTLMTLSFPIWSILGQMQRKFVVIISQTQEQAKQHFKNLKHELETNDLLKRDLGPFQEQDEWKSCSLIIPKYNAKIIAVSREQSFRGVKHGQYRPDLLVADDIENSESVKTQESRDDTYNWFYNEVLPLGDKRTKVIVTGNLLHESSLLKRLEQNIKEGKQTGIFRQYPLLDENNNIAWPGKFPDMLAIKAYKLDVGANIYSWNREYLLRIVDEREPVVYENWIHYYDELPEPSRGESYSFVTGVDLAISQKNTASYTALITAKVIGYGNNQKIYILPNPVNARMGFPKIVEKIKNICKIYEGRGKNIIYVEDQGTQGYVVQQLKKKENVDAIGVPIQGKDKRSRLELSSPWIYNGKVYFPHKGCGELLHQILNLGITRYDDLCDAFTILILGMLDNPPSNDPQIMFVKHDLYGHIGKNLGHSSISDSRSGRGSRKRLAEFLDQEDKDVYANHGRGRYPWTNNF